MPLRKDAARAKGVSGGKTVRNSAEGAVRFLRRRRKKKMPRTRRTRRTSPPMTPPAISPAWDWVERVDLVEFELSCFDPGVSVNRAAEGVLTDPEVVGAATVGTEITMVLPLSGSVAGA